MEQLKEVRKQILDAKRLLLNENELWLNELSKINDLDARYKIHIKIESNFAKIEGLDIAYELVDTEIRKDEKLY